MNTVVDYAVIGIDKEDARYLGDSWALVCVCHSSKKLKNFIEMLQNY